MSKEIKQVSIKRNIIYSTLFKILNLIGYFITAPYIARVLGVAGVGTYSFIMSIASYFCLIAGLGTAVYGSLEIAKVRDDLHDRSKSFFEIELLSIFTSMICVSVWMIYSIFNQHGNRNYLFFCFYILATMFDISWFFAGIEHLKHTVSINSIVKIISIVAQFVFVKKPEDLSIYILIMCASMLIGNASLWLYIPRYITRISLSELKILRHLKGTLIFFVPAIANSVFSVLDKTLIGVITHSAYENGYYEQAHKVINFIQSLAFTGLNTVVGSRISYLFTQNKFDDIKKHINKSIDFILFIGFAAIFGIFGTGALFIRFFFGDEYSPAITILYFLAPLILIIGVSNTLGGQYYNPAGLRAKSLKYLIIAACLNILLNVILIPNFGAIGAAIASIIAETVATVLYACNCKDFFKPSALFKFGWKKMLSGVVMLFALYLLKIALPQSIVALIIQFVVGAIVYCVSLLILNDSFINISTLKSKFLK